MKKLPKKLVVGRKHIVYRTLISVIMLSTIYYLLSTSPVANAQELQRTYTVINPSIAQKLDPGGHTEGTTRIINESNVPLTFTAGIQDYTVTDTNGTPQILPPNTLNNKYSAAAWIGITPSLFTLKPGQAQTLNYYIQAPLDARPGGHYAAIIYQPQTIATQKATGGVVNTQIGSLFYITIKGPITESAKVTKFFANGFQEYGPIKVLTQIKNFGDLHIAPQGSITVSGLFFNKKQDFPSRNIFPESSRDFESAFGNLFMLGRYKAELTATYGQNNNLPLVASLYVWVFPWRLVIVIILVIVAVYLGTTYYKKRKENGHKASGGPKKEAEEAQEEAKNPDNA